MNMISNNARTVRCWCSHATLIILLPFTPSVSLCASYSSIMSLHSSPPPMLLSPVLSVGWGCLRTDWIHSCPRWCHSSLPSANWKRRIALHCIACGFVGFSERNRLEILASWWATVSMRGVESLMDRLQLLSEIKIVGGKWLVSKERTISVSLKHHWVCVL